MLLVILPIPDPMIRETRLPDGTALLMAIRKSPLDELHDALERNLFSRREQRVEVIGHDDEFVKKKLTLVAIMRENLDQESGSRIMAKDRKPLNGVGRNEEYPVGIHHPIIAELRALCR